MPLLISDLQPVTKIVGDGGTGWTTAGQSQFTV